MIKKLKNLRYYLRLRVFQIYKVLNLGVDLKKVNIIEERKEFEKLKLKIKWFIKKKNRF